MGKDIGTLTFDTFNDLRKISGSQSSSVKVLGKDTPNDFVGGLFYWDQSSEESDDNQNVIQKTGLDPGRWIRANLYTINLSNNNLFLTGNREINGQNFTLSFQNTTSTTISSNSINFVNTSSNIFRFGGVNGGNLFLGTTNIPIAQTVTLESPLTSGTISTQDYVTTSTASTLSSANAYTDSQIDNNRNRPLVTDGSGNITDSYLVNKDLTTILGAGLILEKGKHFNKALNSNQVVMISPNTLLPSYNYTPIYN